MVRGEAVGAVARELNAAFPDIAKDVVTRRHGEQDEAGGDGGRPEPEMFGGWEAKSEEEGNTHHHCASQERGEHGGVAKVAEGTHEECSREQEDGGGDGPQSVSGGWHDEWAEGRIA